MNYDNRFICTYQLLNNNEYEDSLILYQMQFMQAFKLDISKGFDDNVVNETTLQLYELYKNNDYIKNLIENRKRKMAGLDSLDIFKTYFGYDTFYLFHLIICKLLSKSNIDLEIYDKLMIQ